VNGYVLLGSRQRAAVPKYGRVALVWLSGRIEIAELPVERVDALGDLQTAVGGRVEFIPFVLKYRVEHNLMLAVNRDLPHRYSPAEVARLRPACDPANINSIATALACPMCEALAGRAYILGSAAICAAHGKTWGLLDAVTAARLERALLTMRGGARST
jgi:hypothetical protein